MCRRTRFTRVRRNSGCEGQSEAEYRAAGPRRRRWLLVLTMGCGLSGEGDPTAGVAYNDPQSRGLQRRAPEPTPTLEPAALAATAEAVASALKPSDAAGHVGEEQTVCGTVTGTRQADSFKPLFLDFGPPFPDQVFMVHFITFTGRVGDWPDQIDRSIRHKGMGRRQEHLRQGAHRVVSRHAGN